MGMEMLLTTPHLPGLEKLSVGKDGFYAGGNALTSGSLLRAPSTRLSQLKHLHLSNCILNQIKII